MEATKTVGLRLQHDLLVLVLLPLLPTILGMSRGASLRGAVRREGWPPHPTLVGESASAGASPGGSVSCSAFKSVQRCELRGDPLGDFVGAEAAMAEAAWA